MNATAATIIVRGEVQGVGFRWFTHRKATEVGVLGFVQNLGDGSVEVQAEGEKSAIDALIGALQIGPRAARVDNVAVTWSTPTGKYTHFEIAHD